MVADAVAGLDAVTYDFVVPARQPWSRVIKQGEVLRLIAEGHSNPAIGEALFISPKTASVHVSHILAKLNVKTRAEATALAYKSGLL